MDDKTAIVALPHCQWTDGALIDLETIGSKARALGAALVIDITQSGGALPFDVQAVRPDFMICATYKWLLGPYSLGFLYAAPDRQEGRPLEENWIAREDSEDFARLVDYKDGYQPGARRYDMGERSNFHLMPMANAALEQILDWGVEAIAATLGAKTASLARRAEALGLKSAPPDRRAGHYLGLRPHGSYPADLLQKLAADGVFVSIRGSAMRVTPHLYNTAADEDRLMAALAAHLGAGA
jgi:selenocysteine lyase/cysteine desulfurase